MAETIQRKLNDSSAARWTALLLIASTMFFGYMFVDLMSPLQSMIEAQRGWTPDVFGMYGSSEFILNVFGFLILAGIILDKMGVRFTGQLSASLMFIGACAGSTSGGIKISRVAILCKSLKRELKRLAHPHHVSVLKVDGQAVEERVVSSAGAFIAAYLLVLLAGALVVSWDNYGFQESFAASLTCISNVGPGLGILGPMENFSILSPLSKLVLSLEMLMGRLELMPLLALFLGSTWRD